MSWLEVIRQDLEQIGESDLIEPPAEAEEGEEILGEASLYLRRLWTLIAMMQKKAALAEVEMAFCSVPTPTRTEELRAQVWELTSKAQALKRFFWTEANDEFSSWDRPAIGIRKDWMVVVCKEDHIPDIIKRILGG
ncbi:MAG: hypothetical protein WAP55_02865 [Minisyncoccia bacterium]